MFSFAPLLIAAAFVGFLHMSAPDHWITLVILGRFSKWTRTRLFGVSIMTAAGHVTLSILLGLGVVALGLVFSQQLSFEITEGTGLLMVVAGLAYGVRELKAAGAVNLEEKIEDRLPRADGALGKRFRYFAVLGAALSPDLSILPIFLLAIPAGVSFAFDIAVVFAVSSTLALSLLVMLGSTGLARALERFPAKYNNPLVGFVVAAVGGYILVAG